MLAKKLLNYQIEFPITHINILYRWLLIQGYSKKSLLSHQSITEQMLEDDESYTTFFQQHQFIVNALHVTKNELLGIDIGHYIATQYPGLLGYAIKCSPTLNKALDILSQNFQLRNSLFTTNKILKKEVCLLTFDEATDFEHARGFLSLMFVSAFITLFKKTIHYLRAIKSVSLTMHKPKTWSHDFYPEVPFYFNAKINSIAFDTHYLEYSIKSSDPLTLKHLQEYFTLKSLNNVHDSFINQVTRIIVKHNLHPSSQDDIATELGLSTRTLRRKLQEHDITYKEILNRLRAEKAINLLKNNKLKIYQICEKMGYNNLSNFRRAFRVWTGKCFKDFR